MKFELLQERSFLLLLIAVSAAFAWLLLPFFGAVFWGAVLALMFTPLYRRLLRSMRNRRNLAAATTLLLCLVVVILPSAFIAAAFVEQASLVYQDMQTRRLDVAAYIQQIVGALPPWLANLLDRFGLGDLESMQEKLAAGAGQASKVIASQVVNVGQNAFEFLVGLGVMLYLLFFLLRDGGALTKRIDRAIPLSEAHKAHLAGKFATVIRATIKGNVVVAAVQGTLGGLILWFLGVQAALLWGVVMAFLSLLPAVGAAIVWLPVAVYFLLAGAVWKGVVLIAFGVFVIGLVDNVLRPILVGKDTQMPDYLVLISTLGGLALFGINGFVIGPVIAALFMAVWDLFSQAEQSAAA
ncbi:AI-2E family transporter [Piscinibacter sp.]|uniref:AI-2E family transporter n=1 Tax=Piscinibacter sp. TaxID=1903157 RepID=UPI002C156299|nr:AI-2E family transporter [Albitalea sp.]HUG24372.1 AI-2E family transporter [Albitalea sp.]